MTEGPKGLFKFSDEELRGLIARVAPERDRLDRLIRGAQMVIQIRKEDADMRETAALPTEGKPSP